MVGESWEISVEPSFPSAAMGDSTLLRDLISADPLGWLGSAVSQAYGGQTPLLVKLLDTADNLSVQVHPAMDDPALAEDESGKPESWIVLEARPGAGIYLGLREGVGRAEVEACLQARGPLDRLLNFVPCKPGDAFVIGAGTVHAIGAGITLLEPQHVAPGKRGLTYRFWDWNRLYDANGVRSPNGQPRQLHVERSLAVTNFAATGEAFVASCRAQSTPLSDGAVRHVRLLRSQWFEAESARGAGPLNVSLGGTMTGLTVLAGVVRIDTAGGTISVPRGQSAVVPARLGQIRLRLEDAHCIMTRSRA